MEFLYFLILVFTVLFLAYKRVPLVMSMVIMIVLTIAWTELRLLFYVPSWFRFSNGIVAVTLIGFTITPLRRLLISDRLYNVFRKALPRVSETEQEALDAGTVWWDAEIFSGRPRWRNLLKYPAPSLSEKELAFLDGPVNLGLHAGTAHVRDDHSGGIRRPGIFRPGKFCSGDEACQPKPDHRHYRDGAQLARTG
jgi:acyl-CoA dehydrogenase